MIIAQATVWADIIKRSANRDAGTVTTLCKTMTPTNYTSLVWLMAVVRSLSLSPSKPRPGKQPYLRANVQYQEPEIFLNPSETQG